MGIIKFDQNTTWRREFIWWPTRCAISNRIIFLQSGYRMRVLEYALGWGVNFWTTVWITSTEFLIARIKGEIWTKYEEQG